MLSEPNCSKRGCRNYLGHARTDGTDETLVHVCDAYPLGIPDEIAYGEDLHFEVRQDQVGAYVFDAPM